MTDVREVHFSLRVAVPAEAQDDLILLKLQQLLSLSGLPFLLQPALFESQAPDKENLN